MTTMETIGIAADGVRAGLRVGVTDLIEHEGEDLGYTAWRTLTQPQVDEFASLTEDRNPIHVDPEHAKATPFGGTIVHGYFTVALLAPLLNELLSVTGSSLAINYGIDKLRFPGPLPVGARFRCGAQLAEVAPIDGGFQIRLAARVDVEGAPKPALVADCLFRYYA
jgi:acyl dehydratase